MSLDAPERYVGRELDLFLQAQRWKAYFAGLILPHLGRDVVEVGAGRGGTTSVLCHRNFRRWLCLEPDPELARVTRQMIEQGELPECCESRVAALSHLEDEERFDSVLYIDVLEHIADDAAEVRLAASRLRVGGKLIVLAPAHQWLYSEFDRAIGHHRRYTRQSLCAAMPRELELREMKYLDAVGLLASLGNRFVSRSSTPTAWQIKLWDRGMIPCSRRLDPVIRHSFGKSLLGVWQRTSA
jgi:2-polyprenyl-3-methyl-5-hydroxy-6-metoxy-1,4-benzoquinol methylase